MLMRALLPRRGRGGRSKSWVAQHQTCLARIPNPLYSHADASPCPLRYPVDWAGVQSEKKKNTKPNPNKRFISLETERRPRPWGTLWAGRSAGMGMGCATSPLGKPGKARRLAGRHALPSPTMQGQPGRARGAGYSGRSPGPEGWLREGSDRTLEVGAVQARRWPAQARCASLRADRAPCWPLAGRSCVQGG